mgnify:CR=1 FL=1
MNRWVLTVCVVCSAWLILRYIRVVLSRFQLPGEMTTGKFEGEDASNSGVVDGGHF